MKALDVLGIITERAKEYRFTANRSIRDNKHMNKSTGTTIPQADIDALLVDFINYVAWTNSIDYALYTSDLDKP